MSSERGKGNICFLLLLTRHIIQKRGQWILNLVSKKTVTVYLDHLPFSWVPSRDTPSMDWANEQWWYVVAANIWTPVFRAGTRQNRNVVRHLQQRELVAMETVQNRIFQWLKQCLLFFCLKMIDVQSITLKRNNVFKWRSCFLRLVIDSFLKQIFLLPRSQDFSLVN